MTAAPTSTAGAPSKPAGPAAFPWVTAATVPSSANHTRPANTSCSAPRTIAAMVPATTNAMDPSPDLTADGGRGRNDGRLTLIRLLAAPESPSAFTG